MPGRRPRMISGSLAGPLVWPFTLWLPGIRLCVNVGCYAPGSSKNERPAAANGLEKLRRHLLLPSRLSAGLRPIDLLLGLRYYVYSVATLQALHIFSVHVPVSVDVTLTPGTCLEINHRA